MTQLSTDIKQGVRAFRHALPFATAIVGILALGIGLATAVFTVANAVLFRRLPVLDQDRVVVLSGEAPRKGLDNVPLEYPAAEDFARRTHTLSHTAFFLYNGAVPVTVREGQRISRLQEALVSGNYFDVLGTRPLIGRLLRREDESMVRSRWSCSVITPGSNASVARRTSWAGRSSFRSTRGRSPSSASRRRGSTIREERTPGSRCAGRSRRRRSSISASTSSVA